MKLNKTNLVESEIIAVDFKNYILKHSISLEPDFSEDEYDYAFSEEEPENIM